MLARTLGLAALIALSALLIFGARSGVSNETDAEAVNRQNADGSTPLQWAVYNGDAAEVRRLI